MWPLGFHKLGSRMAAFPSPIQCLKSEVSSPRAFG